MRAFQRSDMHATTTLLARSTSLLPESSARRLELLSELGLALRIRGEVEGARDALREAVGTSRREGEERLARRAELELAAAEAFGGGDPDQLVRVAEESTTRVFGPLADHRSLSRAWVYIGDVRGGFYCQNSEWERALEEARVHYHAAGWPTTTFVGSLAAALFYGPRPVTEAVQRAKGLLGEEAGVAGEANVFVWLAALEALRGRFEQARLHAARAGSIYDEVGFDVPKATTWSYAAALIEASRGDAAAAAAILMEGCVSLERFEQWSNLATHAAHLADVLQTQGSIEEAEEWALKAQKHSQATDISAEFSWRAALARIRGAQGKLVEAEELARTAVGLVAKTDAVYQHGRVLLALAEVLDAAGKREEARKVLDEASGLFKAKGAAIEEKRAAALRRDLVVA